MSRILFRGEAKISYHCDDCNSDIDITKLVEILRGYGLYDCPENLYQAWKILRLGTNEYEEYGRDLEHRIIREAVVEAA